MIFATLKGFWNISCFSYFSFLRYLQSLNSISQVLNNFHINVGKIELLIIFEREKSYQHEIFASYLSSKGETTDVSILIDDIIFQNGVQKSKILLLAYL